MIIIIYFCHNYHYYYEQLEQVKQFKYLGRYVCLVQVDRRMK